MRHLSKEVFDQLKDRDNPHYGGDIVMEPDGSVWRVGEYTDHEGKLNVLRVCIKHPEHLPEDDIDLDIELNT